MNSTLDMIGQRFFPGDRVAWVSEDDHIVIVGLVIEIDEFRMVRIETEVVPPMLFQGVRRVDANELIVTRSQKPAAAPSGRH